jgi:hypothetical protein
MSSHLVFASRSLDCVRLKSFNDFFIPRIYKVFLRIAHTCGAWIDGQETKTASVFVCIAKDHQAVFRRFRPAFWRRVFNDVELCRLTKDHVRNEQEEPGDE